MPVTTRRQARMGSSQAPPRTGPRTVMRTRKRAKQAPPAFAARISPAYRFTSRGPKRLRKGRTDLQHRAARRCPFLEHVPGYTRCANAIHTIAEARKRHNVRYGLI